MIGHAIKTWCALMGVAGLLALLGLFALAGVVDAYRKVDE